ncbi:MAG: D-alanine--poly(phosphoribitol) ligase subunit 2 [Firmicutes bacterium ADurb.Bin419]|nr:MAG: D-alanine--poly(phosphoribitol) ligase subunit 2 [Firmicutes bacterium ADurb.Bin419]
MGCISFEISIVFCLRCKYRLKDVYILSIENEIKELMINKFNLTEEILSSSKSIIDEGLLSSIEFVKLTIELENLFDLEFDEADFNSANFKDISTIAGLINQKKGL